MTNINDLSQAVAQHLDHAAASARALAEEADVQNDRGNQWKAKAAERRRQLAEALSVSHVTPWERLIEEARNTYEKQNRWVGYLNDARDAAGAPDWPSLPDTVGGIVQRARDAEKQLAKAKERGDIWKAKAVEMEADRDRADKALADAEERARKATASALNLRAQTENAAHATLGRIRDARTWADVWTQLGMYYGMKPEEAGQEARARREGGTIANLADAEQRVRAAKQRADQAEGDAERYKADYERACKQISDMHAAAVGEVRGPIRGVVQDVADVRERAEQAEKSAEQQLAAVQMMQQTIDHHRDRAERQLKEAHRRAGEAARNLRDAENNLADERRKTRQLIERAHRAEGALDHVAAERDRYREQAEELRAEVERYEQARDRALATAEPVGTVEPVEVAQ